VTVVSPLSHVSAMQAHGGHGAASTNMSQHCMTTCNSAATKKENKLADFDHNDDEPVTPYYLQFESLKIDFQEIKLGQTRDIDVQTKVPLYRLYQVVRQ